VGDSADLELAAKEIVKNAFYNNGQSYDSLNRVYIEEDIEEIFLDLLRKEI
jgi:acyl-CoA reductase-like NAD-dependent aldehyde dehydrogenase